MLNAMVRGLIDLVIPRVCVLCEHLIGEGRSLVCYGCWSDLRLLARPRCARCGHPTYGRPCEWCSLLAPEVWTARSVCWVPEGVGGEIVHKLKYDGWTRLAEDMADRMAAARPPEAPGEPMLVPVPLGESRRRERGFNQCELLAGALATRWQMRVAARALVRNRETTSQVRLTPDERSANVHRAFEAGPAANALCGAHVVLVDDVITTAATLNACAAAVVAAGAASISYVTFGRARAAFDRRTQSGEHKRWLFASASTASAELAARSSAPPRSGDSPISTSSPSTT